MLALQPVPYQKSLKPMPANKKFSFVEKQVYSICNESLTLEDILDNLKLNLDQKHIIQALDRLVLEGLIEITDSNIKASKSKEKKLAKVGNLNFDNNLLELCAKLENELPSYMSLKEAKEHVETLKTCKNIPELKYQARKLSLKLKLTRNIAASKDLLDALS